VGGVPVLDVRFECRRKLTEDPTAASDAIPLGEHAHIVAESPDGPPGQSVLEDAERVGYTNRILLCPSHHTLIDKAPKDYPVERLHIMKRDHELWVEQQLGAQDDRIRVAYEVYASLIDAAVEACDLEHWNEWASAPSAHSRDGAMMPTPSPIVFGSASSARLGPGRTMSLSER
jgi:hypothetical protein